MIISVISLQSFGLLKNVVCVLVKKFTYIYAVPSIGHEEVEWAKIPT